MNTFILSLTKFLSVGGRNLVPVFLFSGSSGLRADWERGAGGWRAGILFRASNLTCLSVRYIIIMTLPPKQMKLYFTFFYYFFKNPGCSSAHVWGSHLTLCLMGFACGTSPRIQRFLSL